MLTQKICVTLAALFGLALLNSTALAATDAQTLERGAYLAKAGDCIACHSSPGGQPFAGGLAIATPLGNITSTNITPSKTNGIGNYTLAQFGDAVRRGVRADGAHLYPAMPYTAYAKVNDEDLKALYAYFMESVAPVNTSPVVAELPFPFNIRMSMMAWNLLFLDSAPFAPDAARSPEWNRGAYLVNGLAHCTTCHTPRNPLMAEDLSKGLGGADLGTWYAPNISSDPVSGIGGWSEAEIATYLSTGRAVGKAQAAGPMAEAIDHSLRYLTEPDLKAIAVYLKSTPPIRNAADTQPAYSWGKATPVYAEVRGVDLPANADRWTGAQLYDANCASCHQAGGEGVERSADKARLPSLFHNTALGHANSNNLVMAILEGVPRQPGGENVMMPPFAAELSNVQIATLSNYLLKNFGNPAATVTPEQVRTLRDGGKPSPLVLVARMAMAVGLLLAVLLAVWLARRKR